MCGLISRAAASLRTMSILRRFSWKSRISRDPELRQKKLESLKKRYTLRRIGVLQETEAAPVPGSKMLSTISESLDQRLSAISIQTERLCQIHSVEKSDLESTRVGDTIPLFALTSAITQPNPRSAVVVVKDKGNTERVFKALKRSFPSLIVSIMDRERVEVKLPRITEELRLYRGNQVAKLIEETRKTLKNLELQSYDQIKKGSYSSSDALSLRTKLRESFASAEKTLEQMEEKALDSLGLE